MNIFVNEQSQPRVVLKGWLKGLISVCLLGAPVALGYLGYQFALAQGQAYSHENVQSWQQQLREQADSLAQVKRKAEEELEALTVRLALLQARLLRLSTLSDSAYRLAQVGPSAAGFSQHPDRFGFVHPLVNNRLPLEDFALAQADFSGAESRQNNGHASDAYAELLADVDEAIRRRQALALADTAVRATNPHVHLNVYKHGRIVDPAAYIHRTIS